MYESFDRFLGKAVRVYYERTAGRQRGDFLALLIASGELASVAAERVAERPVRHAVGGAAALVGLRLGLGLLLSGPLGLVVGGLTLASLTRYLLHNQRAVLPKVQAFTDVIADTRTEYERVQDGHADGRYTDDERALLVDGLTHRLLADLEARGRQVEAELSD